MHDNTPPPAAVEETEDNSHDVQEVEIVEAAPSDADSGIEGGSTVVEQPTSGLRVAAAGDTQAEATDETTNLKNGLETSDVEKQPEGPTRAVCCFEYDAAGNRLPTPPLRRAGQILVAVALVITALDLANLVVDFMTIPDLEGNDSLFMGLAVGMAASANFVIKPVMLTMLQEQPIEQREAGSFAIAAYNLVMLEVAIYCVECLTAIVYAFTADTFDPSDDLYRASVILKVISGVTASFLFMSYSVWKVHKTVMAPGPGGAKGGLKNWLGRKREAIGDTIDEIEWTGCQDCWLGGMRNILLLIGVSFIAFFCFMMCANLFGMYSLATRLGSSREQGWTDVWFGAAWWMYSTISFFALAVGSYNAGWKLYRMGVYGPKWWRTMLLGGGCHRACCGEAAPEEEV